MNIQIMNKRIGIFSLIESQWVLSGDNDSVNVCSVLASELCSSTFLIPLLSLCQNTSTPLPLRSRVSPVSKVPPGVSWWGKHCLSCQRKSLGVRAWILRVAWGRDGRWTEWGFLVGFVLFLKSHVELNGSQLVMKRIKILYSVSKIILFSIDCSYVLFLYL